MWYCEFHRPDSRSPHGGVRTEFWRSYSWPWSWWHHCCGGSEQAQLGRRGGHYCAQWKCCFSNLDALRYLNLYNVLLLTEKLWIRQTKNRSFQLFQNKEVLKVNFSWIVSPFFNYEPGSNPFENVDLDPTSSKVFFLCIFHLHLFQWTSFDFFFFNIKGFKILM